MSTIQRKKEHFTIMSAVSLKPSAILEATFSATWFGLQQKVKGIVLFEP